MLLTAGSAGVLAVHHLGAHVLQRAAHRHEHVLPALRQLLRQPEVDDAQVVVVLGVGEHDVEGLQVQVEDALAVDEVDTAHDLEMMIS